jgi:uncharacterized membrane protein SpoIIM required for sporulation
MMTPLRFEQLHQEEWSELEIAIGSVSMQTVAKSMSLSPAPGARVALLYRRACEHLALARARAYPAYIVDRLERVTEDAHQLIYHRPEVGLGRLRRVLASEFPAAVRAHRRYVAVAAAVFVLPTLIVGALVYARPELILSVVSAETAASFEGMYSPDAASIGRVRTASTDWIMLGYYIRNNIGVSFQCFAGGLFAGLGTLFFLAYNGAFAGALAGYLAERGLASTFFSFVATHSAFELTAIVLSGAAGLRIGHSLLAPGRLRRRPALVRAAQDTAVLLYGVVAMLIVAAFVEAFWSSARWLPPAVKYAVAAICWSAVLLYFTRQGRHAG